MLDYENQMLLDLLHQDGLIIGAKGLGLENVFVSLLKTYTDPGNLVVIVGTNPKEEEYFISRLDGCGLTPPPRCITADNSISERTQIYLDGGVLFVTSRLLVVDVLMERIPADLITGIIVWKAHRIIESCQEAFILRLYRQKNKVGFIKAFSSSPLSFTAGYCQVERIMRNLFVKKLYLWPRFHTDVSTCLDLMKPEVIELHLKMTPEMREIQLSVVDLIQSTVKELKLSNRSLDIEEFTTENTIARSFEKMVKLQLEPIWHQLSTRTKQLISDLKVLRTILVYLSQYDCVTFLNLVSSLRTTEKAMESGGWMMHGSAESLYINARKRVFQGPYAGESPIKRMKTEAATSSTKQKSGRSTEPVLEVNPKWIALSEVLDEIRVESEDSKEVQKCLIVTQDDRTVQQLKEYLVDGSEIVLRRIFYKTIGVKHGLIPPLDLFKSLNEKQQTETKKKCKDKKKQICSIKERTKDNINNKEDDNLEEITLTQIAKKYESIGQTEGTTNSDEEEYIETQFSSPLTIILSVKDYHDPFKPIRMLEEIQPNYIVMYDSDLTFIRQVEVWQAGRALQRSRVYFLVYKATVEEQVYLTNVKREKDAFQFLIKQKNKMVLPEDTEGRNEDNPDLIRDARKASEMIAVELNPNMRKGGSVPNENNPTTYPKIIVDMREFRSELPALIHKRGIDIEPVTIEVGDYILTPDICVERKSLSDLIGSLNSGRLYNQAVAMTRHYKEPILLIEFDQNKPFHLQGRFFLSSDSSSSSKDVSAKLQLLTLHFPKLRILWCPSPYATAELFELLKANKTQPSVSEAQSVTAEVHPDIDSDNFNPIIKDFLFKLPGISSKNIYSILRNVTDLPELISLDKEKINEIIGNSKMAQVLYSALHHTIKPPDVSHDARGKGSKFTKKGLRRFRN